MPIPRVTQVIASAPDNIEAAIQVGLDRVRDTLPNITGIDVTDIKVGITEGKIDEYRVHMNVTYLTDDSE
jgi:flavin-binding protein dodecin